MVVGQLQVRVLAGHAHEDVDRLVADRHPARPRRSRASRRRRPSGRCRRSGSRCGGSWPWPAGYMPAQSACRAACAAAGGVIVAHLHRSQRSRSSTRPERQSLEKSRSSLGALRALALRPRRPPSSRVLAPGLRRRRGHPDRRHRHDPHRARQRQAQVRRAGSGRPRATSWKSSTTPTRNRSARTPSRWSPRARCRRPPSARKNCFTPKHICLSIAKWHGFNPKTEKITINPAKAGAEGWSTMGSTTQEGRLLVHRRKDGHLDHPAW